ncbi:hypothetical protein PCASD_03152 [Puccinia coronata f. sp. avenae]|uniref:CCHC-type domain-containing protein n=1 Tax=Puccinia coronata f. sp. avenae TaxID=200324 RepID=A0A2N5S5P6_9BASI|nr:hypothetical protein PCASD_26468 [Puccinia coronata f. sp. avenae]PLW48710.1 hypothetical protein PCASD_03152 [Puccinia coronata f. sp. avenae]
MRDTIADLRTLNCRVNDENVMGLLLQRNLPEGAIQLLHVCKQQTSIPTTNSSSYTSSSQPIPDLPFSNIISPHTPQSPPPVDDDHPDQVSANVARNNSCHICKQPGHWSADCPHRKKPIPSRNHSTQLFYLCKTFKSCLIC